MVQYEHKINENNPLRTRCFECGHIIRKKSLARKCPECGFRGSLSIFHKYDLPNCPLCAHIINGNTGHSNTEGKCPLCDSDIAIVLQCIQKDSYYSGYSLDVDKYKQLGGL